MTVDVLFLSQTDISTDARILRSIKSAVNGGLQTYSIGLKSNKKYMNKKISYETKTIRNFVSIFGNLLFPIFLFLSVIWFTSKLANNSEIIAILSSGISFFRFFLSSYICF